MSQKTSAVGVKAGGCGCGSIGWSDANGCGCECGTCAPLATADRARFFGGQRLSAEDLVSEQDYVLLKNRLHNRFLHGWGVVCGLELGCGECPGEVKVLSGYALDPCGNDVVVPCVQRFDVLKAVQQCREAARRKPADCDPYEAPPNVDCDDATEHWCITLRYDEQPYKPSTALRQYANGACGCGGSSHSSGGCGCGGSSNGNGNGGSSCGCGGATTKSSTTVLGVCEPSRVREGFKLGVVQDCGEECPVPEDALRRTFIGRVLCCLQAIRELFGSELSKTERDLIAFHVFDVELNFDALSAKDVYETLCRLRQKVRSVLEDERLPKHCTRLRELDLIVIPKPGVDEVLDVYVNKVGNHFRTLVALLVDHIRDCVCDALLPPCPEGPCDDRIILGCVDIRDGELIEVCAVSKRRYAGSFPALSYWLSIGPAIGWLLCRMCCSPRLSQSKGERLRLMALFDQLDPSGELRRSVAADDFSRVRRRYADAQSFVKRLKPKNLSHTVTDLLERFLEHP
jgi:hypothetical protein